MKQNKIYYATSNASKFGSVYRYISTQAPHIFLQQYDRDVAEIQSLSQVEIAINKAQQAWDYLKQPVLVDDTGFYIEKYNQFPGTLSKFVFEGIGFEGLLKLASPGDKAFFMGSIVYCDGPGQYKIFEDRCEGAIVKPIDFNVPKGYPYIFFFTPNGSSKSYAELYAAGEDEPFNFRIKALKKFITWYDSL